MQRTLLIVLILFSGLIWACKDNIENAGLEAPGNFNKKQHQDQWDNQLHPLLLQYFSSLQSLREQDTTALFASSHQIMSSIDTLLIQEAVDTMGKKALLESLQSLHDEYSALPLETNWVEIHSQMSMIARDWIYLLGSIGYQKIPVYIFEQDEMFWLYKEKSSMNPYRNLSVKRNASFLLQELPSIQPSTTN